MDPNAFAFNVLAFMTVFYLACLIFSFLFVIGFGIYGWKKLEQYLKMRRREALRRMNDYNLRLSRVVNHLLARANEVDQESKYIETKMTSRWSQAMANTCTELVLLGDAVKMIERQIESADLQSCRKSMLESVHIAGHLSLSLDGLQAEMRLPQGESIKGKQKESG
jgi:hypothetical protein